MNILAAFKLIVALAIAMEIRPEDLARIFASDNEVQEYYNALLASVPR